jgi:hypothetical protein
MTPDDPLDEPIPPGPAFDLLAAIDAMDADNNPADPARDT